MRGWLARCLDDVLTAFQFLTRLPVSPRHFDTESMVRSAKFYPLVGLLLGSAAVLLQRLLNPHLSRTFTALLVVTFLIWATVGLHEDGLADTADGLGGGWTREQSLTIMRDSRIGSFGAIAIILSVLARVTLLAETPPERFLPCMIAAQVLSRWTILPLSYFLKPARIAEGEGAKVAGRLSFASLIGATIFTLLVVGYLWRINFWVPLITAIVVSLLSALNYRRKLGGVTGDCLGATVQLTEIAIYVCGVWH